MAENKIAVFQEKNVRRTFHNAEWYFSIINAIQILTDASIPRRYWSDLKRKLEKEGSLNCTKKSYN